MLSTAGCVIRVSALSTEILGLMTLRKLFGLGLEKGRQSQGSWLSFRFTENRETFSRKIKTAQKAHDKNPQRLFRTTIEY